MDEEISEELDSVLILTEVTLAVTIDIRAGELDSDNLEFSFARFFEVRFVSFDSERVLVFFSSELPLCLGMLGSLILTTDLSGVFASSVAALGICISPSVDMSVSSFGMILSVDVLRPKSLCLSSMSMLDFSYKNQRKS